METPSPRPRTCTLKSGTLMCHYLKRRTCSLKYVDVPTEQSE
jgi:hypothetical protein